MKRAKHGDRVGRRDPARWVRLAALMAATIGAAEAQEDPMELTGGDGVLLTAETPVYIAGGVNPPPTPLEILAHEAGSAAARATAAASDARATASEVGARLSAVEAEEASKHAMSEEVVTAAAASKAGQAVQQELVDKAGVDAGAGKAKMEFQKGLAYINGLDVTAAKAGTDGVMQLAPLYKAFQEWKVNVLHPLTREAQKNGARKAAPYERALRIMEKRVADYNERATGLSNQARGLRTVAQGMANGAVVKQADGDVMGAQKDMMNAHQMMAQAAQFERQGELLMRDTQVLGVNIPAYMAAAQDAQHAGVYEKAPKLYAPPPVGAAGGMPPPTDVFLQVPSADRAPVDERREKRRIGLRPRRGVASSAAWVK